MGQIEISMRYFVSILLWILLLAGMSACNERDIKKPEDLISQKKVIKMLADIHLAEAMSRHQSEIPDSLRLSSTDLFYSVLKKYDVPDSIFVRSVIYYSSLPRNYEQIYNDVLNTLKTTENEFSEKKKLNVGNEPEKKEATEK